MKKTEKKEKKVMRVAIYILLGTWIVLLALLAAIYFLRLQGYDNFKDWQEEKQNQEVPGPEVITPFLTSVPDVVLTPAITQEATVTPEATPTSTPTPAPTIPLVRQMVFSENEAVDAMLRVQAEDIFGLEVEPDYITFENGIYFSTVFKKENEIFPVVYNLVNGEKVVGSDLIKETYFAIVKERLQTYVAENFPEAAEDAFTSYDQVYEAEDYQQFYLTETELVFCFEEGVLAENQPAFSYSTELAEAQAFFKNNLDGSANGPAIRELDPEAKMIAITFDDGPYPKVEEQIFALFEKYGGRTTFFFLGQRIDDWYSDMPKRAYEAGHEVASHTYSHTLNFATATNQEIWSEINQTNLSIAKSAGYAPDYVRFPGGTAGTRSLQVPMVAVNWNIDSIDYRQKKKKNGAELIYKQLMKSIENADGGIVLLHSIYQTSYDAVEMFVEKLAEEGYELVTLSELFYYKGIETEPGIVYLDGNGTTGKRK